MLDSRQSEPMQREFTAVIEKKGRWYVGTIEEIPGVNTQGRTLTEVRRNLKEAIFLCLATETSDRPPRSARR